jgi:hypothetical protein
VYDIIPTVRVVPGLLTLVGDKARNVFKQKVDLQSGPPFSHSTSLGLPSAKSDSNILESAASAGDYAENTPEEKMLMFSIGMSRKPEKYFSVATI